MRHVMSFKMYLFGNIGKPPPKSYPFGSIYTQQYLCLLTINYQRPQGREYSNRRDAASFTIRASDTASWRLYSSPTLIFILATGIPMWDSNPRK